jgi:hypothetical protein
VLGAGKGTGPWCSRPCYEIGFEKKNRRGREPSGPRPRRLTLRRATRKFGAALRLAIQQIHNRSREPTGGYAIFLPTEHSPWYAPRRANSKLIRVPTGVLFERRLDIALGESNGRASTKRNLRSGPSRRRSSGCSAYLKGEAGKHTSMIKSLTSCLLRRTWKSGWDCSMRRSRKPRATARARLAAA